MSLANIHQALPKKCGMAVTNVIVVVPTALDDVVVAANVEIVVSTTASLLK